MQRKLIVSALLIVLFLALGASIATVLVKTRKSPPRVQTHTIPLLVTTLTIEPETITETLEGFGTARADRYAEITAQVSGEVIRLADAMRPGTAVKQDQILLNIDPREYQAVLERVEGKLASDRAQLAQIEVERSNIDRLLETASRELESAEWDHQQVEDLYQAGSAPQREFVQSRRSLEQTRRVKQELDNIKALLPERQLQWEANVKNSQADVQLAQLNLERCTVKAPFDSSVNTLSVDLGERVQVGAVLLSLLDPEMIEVPIELPVSARTRVGVDAACVLSLESQPEVMWEGRIHRIAPSASETSRTFSVYMLVDNREQVHPLIPGYFLKAEIEGRTLENAILIPRNAALHNRVYLYDPADEKAHVREIEVTRHLRDRSLVSGLSAGEILVTSNFDSLHDGMPIRLETSEDQALNPATAASVTPSADTTP